MDTKDDNQDIKMLKDKLWTKKSQHRSRDSNFQKKPTSRRNYTVGRNSKKQHKRMRSIERIRKKNSQA